MDTTLLPATEITACDSLINEHRQMEKLLDTLQHALQLLNADPNLDAIKDTMGKIESHINTHFTCEEKVLFPAVSPYHSMVLMEAEHEELMALRDNIIKLLDNSSLTSIQITQLQETGAAFISDMLDHIGREEAGIFPTCEKSLSTQEKTAVIVGMDAIRQRATHEPTPAITRPERTFQCYQIDLTLNPQRDIFAQRLFDLDTIEAKHITIDTGKCLAAHWSPKQATIICLGGEGNFTANEKTIDLVPGTIINLSPQLTHSVTAKTRCQLLLLLQ